MSEEQNQNDELVGLGVKYPTPIKAPRERVWKFMVDKMYNTEKYLPVTDVKIKDIEPGKHMYREMSYDGKVLKEDIYFDDINCEIRCYMKDEDAVHINKYYSDTGIIEYWQENKNGQRIHWPVPKAPVLKAMKQTKDLAEENN